MKKYNIAVFSVLAGCALSASALDAPMVVPSSMVFGISPDKTVAVSNYYGSIMFFDLVRGGDPKIFSENPEGTVSYSTGIGNFVGNNTICASRGTAYGASAYLYGASGVASGRWYALTEPSETGIGGTNGVTPDGSRLCGIMPTGVSIGIDTDGIMAVPAVWSRTGNTFTRTMLPLPEGGDYMGMSPQYVTAVCISADGRTVVGQLRSNNGFINEILLYRQDDAGNWSVTKPFEALVNPNHREFPEYPGDDVTAVTIDMFMTEEQFEQYANAMDAYNADPTGKEEPRPQDFMTPEQIAEYNAAVVPFLEWLKKYEAFDAVDRKVKDESVSFVFNGVALSSNGKYIATSGESGYYDQNFQFHGILTPYVYDIEKGTWTHTEGRSISVTGIGDDGTAIGYERTSDIEFGYALPLGASEWVPLEKWVVDRNPELADWVEQNWKHEIEVIIDEEEGITEYQDMYITGMPFANADLSMISTITYCFWNDAPENLRNDYVSYILPLESQSAIDEVQAAEGTGPAEFFNLQGVRMQSEPANGVYLRRQGTRVSKIIR